MELASKTGFTVNSPPGHVEAVREAEEEEEALWYYEGFPSDILAVGKPAILPSLISAHGYGSV